MLDVIVQQLLAKDPAARLQNGKQLCAALEHGAPLSLAFDPAAAIVLPR